MKKAIRKLETLLEAAILTRANDQYILGIKSAINSLKMVDK